MIIVAKIIFIVIAVFGQERMFREKAEAHVESAIDSLNLPVDRPELVLAKRATVAQSLCPVDPTHAVAAASIDTSVSPVADAGDPEEDLVSLCP
jgi:hypothetical protein